MGKFTEYKLPLKSLPEGTHKFEYQLGKKFFENMENTDIHDADVHVDLSVTVKKDFFTLDFSIEGMLTLICDRCLDTLEWPVETGYRINVRYGDDYNDDSDDLLVIPWGDNYLNVAYMLYDTVALTIPLKHVHPLGKCNRQMSQMLRKHRATAADDVEAVLEDGLMDTDEDGGVPSSASLDTDPRWDALKGLSPEGGE